MVISIDEILKDIPDKSEYTNTTSLKFKREFYEFFSDDKFKDVKALEVGSHRGHTTKVMSYLFKEVLTININPKGDDWIPTDRDNINYLQIDCYNGLTWPGKFNQVYPTEVNNKFFDIDVIFIDALRGYENIKSDVAQSLEIRPKKEKYIIVEDYGNVKFDGIKHAIDEICWWGNLEIVKGIGYEPGTKIGGMEYSDWEAVICRTM